MHSRKLISRTPVQITKSFALLASRRSHFWKFELEYTFGLVYLDNPLFPTQLRFKMLPRLSACAQDKKIDRCEVKSNIPLENPGTVRLPAKENGLSKQIS